MYFLTRIFHKKLLTFLTQSESYASMSKDHQYDGVKTLKCIGRYVLCNKTLGKGNFARVELAAHTLINNKVHSK